MYCPMTTAFIVFLLIIHKTAATEFSVAEWKKGCGTQKVCIAHSSCIGNAPSGQLRQLGSEILDTCQLAISFRKVNDEKVRVDVFSLTKDVNVVFTNKWLNDRKALTCDGTTTDEIRGSKDGDLIRCEGDLMSIFFPKTQYTTLKTGSLQGSMNVDISVAIDPMCPLNEHHFEYCPEICLAKDNIRMDDGTERMQFDCGDYSKEGYRLEFKVGDEWSEAKDSKITCDFDPKLEFPKWSTKEKSGAPTMRCIKHKATTSSTGSETGNEADWMIIAYVGVPAGILVALAILVLVCSGRIYMMMRLGDMGVVLWPTHQPCKMKGGDSDDELENGLVPEFKKDIVKEIHNIKHFTHLDFSLSLEANDYVYQPMLMIIKENKNIDRC